VRGREGAEVVRSQEKRREKRERESWGRVVLESAGGCRCSRGE
jgi:hypothetical protein